MLTSVASFPEEHACASIKFFLVSGNFFGKQQRGEWEDKTYHICLKTKQNTTAQIYSQTERMKRKK